MATGRCVNTKPHNPPILIMGGGCALPRGSAYLTYQMDGIHNQPRWIPHQVRYGGSCAGWGVKCSNCALNLGGMAYLCGFAVHVGTHRVHASLCMRLITLKCRKTRLIGHVQP